MKAEILLLILYADPLGNYAAFFLKIYRIFRADSAIAENPHAAVRFFVFYT